MRNTFFALCVTAVGATAIVSGAPNADARGEAGRCFKTERDAWFYPSIQGCRSEEDSQCRQRLDEGRAVRFIRDAGEHYGKQWSNVRLSADLKGYIRRSSITEARDELCVAAGIPRD